MRLLTTSVFGGGGRVQLAALLASVQLLAACTEDVEGPTPELGPAAELVVDPGVICAAQLTTEVVLSGDGFSPLPIDVPGDPKVALPSLELTRGANLDGGSAMPIVVSISGDPDDPINITHLTWQSQSEMRLTIDQSFEVDGEMAALLPVGMYDLAVTNPNENAASQTGVLAVVDKPTLEAPVPGITCLEQGPRTIALSGTTVLDIEGALPVLEVQGVDNPFDVIDLTDCTDIAHDGVAARFCEGASVELGRDSVDPGYPELVLRNPETAACRSEEANNLRVVPAPEIARVAPPLACVAQSDRTFVIEGAGFLEIDDALPRVTINDANFAVDEIGGCAPLETMGHRVRRCDTLTVTVPTGELDPGQAEVFVENPEPAGCSVSNAMALTIVPPPAVDQIVEPLVCLDDGERSIDIEGSDFLTVDGVVPSVRFGNRDIDAAAIEAKDCQSLSVDGLTVRRCATLHVTLAANELPDGAPAVTVTNPDPAGCSVTGRGLLTVVPEPSINEVVPALICVDDGPATVEVVGSDFITVDGTVPAVVFDDVRIARSAIAAEDCEPVEVNGLEVERCERLVVTIDRDEVPLGPTNVEVTNPNPAGCADDLSDALTVVGGPEVTSAAPALVCTDDGARAVTITGSGFLTVDTLLPTVTLDGAAVVVDAALDCTDVAAGGLEVTECTTLEVTVPQGTLVAGDTVVVVQNPAPAACSVTDDVIITAPPSISLAAASPSAACDDSGSYTVVVSGSGFLRVAGEEFTVTVAGSATTPANVTGCISLDVNGLDAESCSEFSFDVDTNALPVGPVEVTVQNPAPDGCALTASALFDVALPPTVAAVAPNNVCSDVATQLVLTGTNFVANTRVFAGAVEASLVTLNSPTELVVDFDTGLAAGTHDITVDNGANCTSTLLAALIVDPTPIVFFVKPSVLYNASTIDATIFTSGLNEDAASVELVDGMGTVTAITDFSSPVRPNRIVAEIPSGLAPDSYEVRVTSALGCVGGLPGAVTVTDQLTLELATTPIDPAFASPTQPTAVTVFADAGGLGFEPGALVYLDPVLGGTATELGAAVVDPNDPFQMSAVVPENLAPGQYDLIVLNPSGDVGLAAAAVTVTSGEPPVVTAVEPISFANSADQLGTIFGSNFDAAGVSVNIHCTPAGSTTTTTLSATVTGGTVTANSVQATFPVSGLPSGTTCVVELINDADGASFQYSAVSIRNPAQNLFPWTESASTMMEGRRALQLVAARPTNTSRFIYAIGGDDGTNAGAKTSVEAAPSDVFGDLGAWSLQRNSLPAPRTQAGSARVGDFAYLTGGHDAIAATNTLLRAQVLDPLAGPEILDIDAVLGDGTLGLGGGLWLYRVAATFPSADASNPSGESLAGDVFSLLLPDVPNRIVLGIAWAEVPGANGYRVYRTPAAGQTVNDFELLSSVSCGDLPCTCGVDLDCRYTDDGQVTTTADEVPLPQGSLGVWHALGSSPMVSAREGHATVAVGNPAAAGESFIYAFGGRDATGTYLDNYEWARITTASDGSQTVSAWTLGTRTIGTAKANLAAWVMTQSDTALLAAGQVQIFVGTGDTGNNSTGEVRSGSLSTSSTDGDLVAAAGNVLDDETAAPNRVGAAFEGGAGFLYVFGGEGNGGALVGTDSSTAIAAGPDLDNWNSLGGGSLAVERAFAASASESAFYYVAGGETGTSAATTSVELTVQ